jgi:acyl-CoA thioester hydrolase
MPIFRFTTDLEIRFRDLDALGHVNNAVYLTYFEIVRTRYWKRLFGLPPADDWGFVMVRTECNYRSPAVLGETITMAARISALRNSSFTFEYRLTESGTGRLIADGLSVQACFDRERGRAIRIPDTMRQRIKDFEGLD